MTLKQLNLSPSPAGMETQEARNPEVIRIGLDLRSSKKELG